MSPTSYRTAPPRAKLIQVGVAARVDREKLGGDSDSGANPRSHSKKFKKGLGRRRPTLPHNYSCSTMGAEELNDRVRDGNGCGLLAGATAPKGATYLNRGKIECFNPLNLFRERMVKPHGPLVPVSFTHYCASTPGLSTLWSTRGLQSGFNPGGELSSWGGFPA